MSRASKQSKLVRLNVMLQLQKAPFFQNTYLQSPTFDELTKEYVNKEKNLMRLKYFKHYSWKSNKEIMTRSSFNSSD